MIKFQKAALFLNSPHTYIPKHLSDYSAIFATDGAYDKFKDMVDFLAVIGDFDSLEYLEHKETSIQKVHTPNPNYTDFEKALNYLYRQSYTHIDVYNGSGGEQDHFLGNLNAAIKYHHKLNICFYDEHQSYFYVDEDKEFLTQAGQIVSLFPFPYTVVSSQGLKYELHEHPLELTGNIGIRNQAIAKNIKIICHAGGYFLFLTSDPSLKQTT